MTVQVDGTYYHFKGNFYVVDEVRDGVVYYHNRATGEKWERPESEWFDYMDRKDPVYMGPRFLLVPDTSKLPANASAENVAAIFSLGAAVSPRRPQ